MCFQRSTRRQTRTCKYPAKLLSLFGRHFNSRTDRPSIHRIWLTQLNPNPRRIITVCQVGLNRSINRRHNQIQKTIIVEISPHTTSSYGISVDPPYVSHIHQLSIFLNKERIWLISGIKKTFLLKAFLCFGVQSKMVP